ncbi:MAG: hypothetical protein Q4B70_17475, partial [Lachnospiraceae bacterium]|nr:hypothetical protein [Lachnospiraceae bacterium]
MKKQSMKHLLGMMGFLCLMLIAAAIPGKKADAATLPLNGTSEMITATAAGEYHTLKMAKDGYVSIGVQSSYGGYYAAANISLY